MSRHKFYVLNGHDVVPVEDVMSWARHPGGPEARFHNHDDDPWRVARTDINDEITVSTVFLGLDHQWHPDGPPLLFETMVFGLPDGDEDQERCSTWDEAVIQHADTVARHRQTRGR